MGVTNRYILLPCRGHHDGVSSTLYISDSPRSCELPGPGESGINKCYGSEGLGPATSPSESGPGGNPGRVNSVATSLSAAIRTSRWQSESHQESPSRSLAEVPMQLKNTHRRCQWVSL